MHLTGRRLYMAKMASRRAEYERREAFLRRNHGGLGNNYSAYASQGVVSGYHTGGGGAAGMAGTGMPSYSNANGGANTNNNHPQQHQHQHQHQRHSSYAVPPPTRNSGRGNNNNNMYRSKSEPQFGEGDVGGGAGQGVDPADERFGNSRGRRNARYEKPAAPPARGRSGKKMHNSHHHHRHSTTRNKSTRTSGNNGGGGGERNGYKSEGYKSDTAGVKTTKSRSTKNNVKKKDGKDQQQQQQQHYKRTKSEQPRQSRGEKSTKVDRTKSKERRECEARTKLASQQEKEERRRERRRRAKSAPARYSSKPSKNNRFNKDTTTTSSPRTSSRGRDNNGGDSSSLPKEYFCPLTKRLMKEPVRDTEGNVYEREAIERWLRVQSSSPITNGYLSLEMLKPDRELKRAIYKATGKLLLLICIWGFGLLVDLSTLFTHRMFIEHAFYQFVILLDVCRQTTCQITNTKVTIKITQFGRSHLRSCPNRFVSTRDIIQVKTIGITRWYGYMCLFLSSYNLCD